MRHNDTQQFIETLKKKFKGDSESLLKSYMGRYGGTYAHWQIAMEYSRYLDAEFAIWCNQVVKDRFELMDDPEELCIPIAGAIMNYPMCLGLCIIPEATRLPRGNKIAIAQG